MSQAPIAAPPKLSPAEGIKQESQYLRGVIGSELGDGQDHFGHSSEILLKFHGTYQQDDRDVRGGVPVEDGGGKRKSYIFMVRCFKWWGTNMCFHRPARLSPMFWRDSFANRLSCTVPS